MSEGIIFFLVGSLSIWAGMDLGWVGSPIHWLGISFLVVGCSYLGLGVSFFGKRKNGTIQPVNLIILLPYLLITWSIWHCSRVLRRITPYNTLRDEVIIGRRLLPAEVPGEVDGVLDLTCEFQEPAGVCSGRKYFALPILDKGVPSFESLMDLFTEIQSSFQGRLYIHCAEGHGRTGTVAAVFLLHRGLAESPEEALHSIYQVRPTVRLSAKQKEFVEMAHRRLLELTRQDRD